MSTSSDLPGIDAFRSEVVGIDPLGFWVLVDAQEYFVPFADYPIFRTASIEQMFNVRRISLDQLYWPDIDADIDLDALDHPEQYPWVWRD